MSFKKLKDLRLHLYGGLLFSIIIFVMLAFYGLNPLAYMVSLTILVLCLIIYISELESIINQYEDFYQSKVQEAYNKLNDCVKNKK